MLVDFADVHAEEIHRRSHGETAHRMVEVQDISVLDRVDLLHRGIAVRVQGERRLRLGRRRGWRVRRRLEGDAADHDGGQRLGFQPEAVRVQGHLNATHIPEARRGGYVAIVGRIHEDPDHHAFAIRVELGRHCFADAHAPEIDGRADVHRSQIRGAQDELTAGIIGRYGRRILQAGEIAATVAGLAGIHGDMRAGEYGSQTERHAAGDARPHDPETGILDDRGASPWA